MRRVAACAVLVFVFALSKPVLAWGPDGHMTVGAIADQILSKRGKTAQDHVAVILSGLDLRSASVWADCAKAVQTLDKNAHLVTKDNSNWSPDDRPGAYSPNDDAFPECIIFEDGTAVDEFKSYVSANWRQCDQGSTSQHCHQEYHFTDVSKSQPGYNDDLAGTKPFDVVHAINAAINVLKGEPAGGPFQITSKREALLLLAHFVGDIHQPLHVAAVYLDKNGNVVEPLKGHEADTTTDGGNDLVDESAAGHPRALHAEWDEIPQNLLTQGTKPPQDLLQEADGIVRTDGDVSTWSHAWATDTIKSANAAFDGLTYKHVLTPKIDHRWDVEGLTPDYWTRANALKAHQLAKAGARLAQVLMEIWPEPADTPAPVPAISSCTGDITGFLQENEIPNLQHPPKPFPARGSAAARADIQAYLAKRPLLNTPRGLEAARDDVVDPADLIPRFQTAFGTNLSQKGMAELTKLLCRIQKDAKRNLDDNKVKLPPVKHGRVRPFVAFPDQPSCIVPNDLVPGHRANDTLVPLASTGSYPSGHAQLGMLMALVLGEISPEHKTDLLARGEDFGNSRLICGFHYPTDLEAGRNSAKALFNALITKDDFKTALGDIRAEIEK